MKKKLFKLISTTCYGLSIGVMSIVFYRWFNEPDLTQMEAFQKYWLGIVIGTSSLILSIIFEPNQKSKNTLQDKGKHQEKQGQ